jgi:hypothetical protein
MLMWSESIDMLWVYSIPLLTRAEVIFYLYQKRRKQALADICENKIQGKTGTENE